MPHDPTSRPAAVPTLDELVERPEAAAGLPLAVATDRLGACTAELVKFNRLRDSLLIRVATANLGPSPAALARDDLFDSIDDAARMVGRSRDFIYKNHRELPFVVQEGRGRRLRFSRSAIERFLATCTGG